MIEWGDIFLLLGFGMAGGFLSGLLGIGGGIIFIFILKYYFREEGLDDTTLVPYVLSNSISATFFAGLSGTLKQIQKGNFYPREVLITGIAGILSGLTVSWTIVEFNWYDRKDLTYVLMLVLPLLLYNIIKKEKKLADINGSREQSSPLWLIIIGLFTGTLSSLTGLGGGIILVPLLSVILSLPLRKATSISLGIIPMQALAMGTFYAFQGAGETVEIPHSTGFLVWPALLPLVVGVVTMAPIGVWASHKFKPSTIKAIFAVVVGLIFIKLLYDASQGN